MKTIGCNSCLLMIAYLWVLKIDFLHLSSFHRTTHNMFSQRDGAEFHAHACCTSPNWIFHSLVDKKQCCRGNLRSSAAHALLGLSAPHWPLESTGLIDAAVFSVQLPALACLRFSCDVLTLFSLWVGSDTWVTLRALEGSVRHPPARVTPGGTGFAPRCLAGGCPLAQTAGLPSLPTQSNWPITSTTIKTLLPLNMEACGMTLTLVGTSHHVACVLSES